MNFHATICLFPSRTDDDGNGDPGLLTLHSRLHIVNTTQGTLGAPLGSALERKYGADQVWVQGVGGPYDATVPGNLMSRGSTPQAIAEMGRLLKMANTKCPDAKVVAGGYS